MTGWVPLKRVAQLTYGDALPAELRNDGKVPVIGSGNIFGRHDRANTGRPAIVVGRKGSYGSIYWAEQGGFVIDTAYYVDRRCTCTDLRWLFYALQSVDLRGASQDVGVPGLSREAAHEVLVPKPPPLEEQRRIADYLDTENLLIESAIELSTRLLATLHVRFQALRDSMIDELFKRSRAVPFRRFIVAIEQGSSPVCDNTSATTEEWGGGFK